MPAESGNVSDNLRRLISDLRFLREQIKSGEVDPVVLRDFRDAVDNVRETAWVVQEWLEKQAGRGDPYALLPLLAKERIRRTSQLSRNLVSDLETVEITMETEGLAELHAAVESLHNLLATLFKKD